MRVVSLIASATEILWALDKGHLQVGRSHECDYPAEVLKLPQTTWTKFDTNGRSYQIDQRVKGIVEEGLSVYGVDSKVLNRLKPDLILTQDHCQVCAVSLGDVEAAVCQVLDSNPAIVSLHPDSLGDIYADIRTVSSALGDPQSGEKLLASFDTRITAIQDALPAESTPSVAFIEWIDPLMAGGNWAPEIIELAGGRDVLGTAGEHSPQLPFAALQQADPDFIIVAPCGFGTERTISELPALEQQDGWSDLAAVQKGNVFIADGNRFFNRPGPSVIDSLEIIAEILHPDRFDFGYREKWWFARNS